MIRRSASVLVLLAVLLAACQSGVRGEVEVPTTVRDAEFLSTLPTNESFSGAVSVVGTESSEEAAAALRNVLSRFGTSKGMTVTYRESDRIEQLLASGQAPDIYLTSQPSHLVDLAERGSILALPGYLAAVTGERWPSAWTVFGQFDGEQYGIPVGVELESLVWYQPQVFEQEGYEVPQTLGAFENLIASSIAGGDTPLCVGIESGPATGWPFTDWVEEMMLRLHGPETYDAWVAGELAFSSPEVTAAWEEVLRIWNTSGAVHAPAGSIATTGFADNATALLDGRCLMHRQEAFFSDFFTAERVAASPGGPVDVFYFPGNGESRPLLASVTLATALRDAPEVWAVMEYLVSPEYSDARQEAQVEQRGGVAGEMPSGFLTAVAGQGAGLYTPLEKSLQEIARAADVVRIDGSDLMPLEVGAGTFWSEATSVISGDRSVADALAAIDASWPGP